MTSENASGNDVGTEEPFPWEKRLESAMAAYSLKRTKRNKERAEMAERRAYGLMAGTQPSSQPTAGLRTPRNE